MVWLLDGIDGTGNPGDAGGGGAGDAGSGGGNAGDGGQSGGAHGGQPSDWRGRVKEDIRGAKSLEKFKDEDGVARGYIELEKKLGGMVSIPKAEATDEEMGAFYDKLGRPKTPVEYQYNRPDIGELKWDEEMLAGFARTAHTAGLNHKQVQKLLDWYGGTILEANKARHTSMRESAEVLKERWGPNFVRNSVLAQRFATQFAGPRIMEKLEKTGLGNDSDFVELFSRMGELAGESGFISLQVQGALTPEDAQKKVQQIMGDTNHPYHDAGKPGHKESVKEMEDLYRIIYRE